MSELAELSLASFIYACYNFLELKKEKPLKLSVGRNAYIHSTDQFLSWTNSLINDQIWPFYRWIAFLFLYTLLWVFQVYDKNKDAFEHFKEAMLQPLLYFPAFFFLLLL